MSGNISATVEVEDRFARLVRSLSDFLNDYECDMDMEHVAQLHSIIGGESYESGFYEPAPPPPHKLEGVA